MSSDRAMAKLMVVVIPIFIVIFGVLHPGISNYGEDIVDAKYTFYMDESGEVHVNEKGGMFSVFQIPYMGTPIDVGAWYYQPSYTIRDVSADGYSMTATVNYNDKLLTVDQVKQKVKTGGINFQIDALKQKTEDKIRNVIRTTTAANLYRDGYAELPKMWVMFEYNDKRAQAGEDAR